jgi:hypothetical protein
VLIHVRELILEFVDQFVGGFVTPVQHSQELEFLVGRDSFFVSFDWEWQRLLVHHNDHVTWYEAQHQEFSDTS